MLNLENLHKDRLHGNKWTIFYDGVRNNYDIDSTSDGFRLLVYAQGNEESYTFGSLSAAIAGIEALENGEEI